MKAKNRAGESSDEDENMDQNLLKIYEENKEEIEELRAEQAEVMNSVKGGPKVPSASKADITLQFIRDKGIPSKNGDDSDDDQDGFAQA